MNSMDTLEQIALETRSAVEELLDAAGMKAGDLLVVGCSSSEVCGGTIGHASSPETGKVIAQTILTACRERGVYLAAQCCEHLNRALIVEREAAEKFGYEPVCVRPQPKAGGSFATAVYDMMEEPTPVEHVRAKAGLDIGGTLIGMHLKEVAVPLRLQTKKVGEAPISAAKTRPKLIGGV
ncbi:MAG: TIGR01440 family protein, partial [Oscillospiraceae bacterium]|nr:TIGR01440 family protein [Oscillospiraceae bacterium]